MNYRRTNLLVLIVLMLLSTVGRLTPPLSCNDQVSIHKWGKMDFSCLSVVHSWEVDRTLIERLKNAKSWIMKTCLLLLPLPHKNVCHPRWMYLGQNIDYFFSSHQNEESYGREQSLFGYSLFFCNLRCRSPKETLCRVALCEDEEGEWQEWKRMHNFS